MCALAAGVLAAALLAGPSACAPNPRPGGEAAPAGEAAAPTAAAPRGAIPPGHLPPPGQCRIWMPDEPVADQARKYPVGRCSTLRETIPPTGWLLYRPFDDARVVRVWQYGEDGRVLHQRIYDVETGALLRHVAPTGS